MFSSIYTFIFIGNIISANVLQYITINNSVCKYKMCYQMEENKNHWFDVRSSGFKPEKKQLKKKLFYFLEFIIIEPKSISKSSQYSRRFAFHRNVFQKNLCLGYLCWEFSKISQTVTGKNTSCTLHLWLLKWTQRKEHFSFSQKWLQLAGKLIHEGYRSLLSTFHTMMHITCADDVKISFFPSFTHLHFCC